MSLCGGAYGDRGTDRYGDAGSGGKTIESCRERSTFGMPLMENQWIHFKLWDLLTEIEILKQFNDHCARIIIRGEDATREVSMGKLTAGCLAREVADTCVPFHGGMGFMEEYPLARYFRDARLLSIGGGVDEVMLGVVVKLEGILPSRKKKG